MDRLNTDSLWSLCGAFFTQALLLRFPFYGRGIQGFRRPNDWTGSKGVNAH